MGAQGKSKMGQIEEDYNTDVEYQRLYQKYKGNSSGGIPNQGTSYQDLVNSQKSTTECPPLGYTGAPEVPRENVSSETVSAMQKLDDYRICHMCSGSGQRKILIEVGAGCAREMQGDCENCLGEGIMKKNARRSRTPILQNWLQNLEKVGRSQDIAS